MQDLQCRDHRGEEPLDLASEHHLVLVLPSLVLLEGVQDHRGGALLLQVQAGRGLL